VSHDNNLLANTLRRGYLLAFASHKGIAMQGGARGTGSKNRDSCFFAIAISPENLKSGDKKRQKTRSSVVPRFSILYAMEGRFEVGSGHVLREVRHLFSF
jgi:hypothetical protein